MLVKLFSAGRKWAVHAILGSIVLALFLLALLIYKSVDQELTDVALMRRASVANLAAAVLSEKLAHLVDIGVSLATRVRFRQLVAQGQWADAVEILRDAPRDLPISDRVFLANAEGTLMADFPELAGARGQNFAQRDWYKGVSQGWRPYVSSVYTRAAAPRLNVFAVAMPIPKEGGGVAGILVLQVQLDSTFFEWTREIESGPEGVVYIVDQNGQLAFDSKSLLRGEIVDFSTMPVVQQVRQGKQGVHIAVDPVGKEETIFAYAPVDSTGWGVITQQRARASLGLLARDNQLTRLLVAYSLFLVLSVLMVYLAYRMIVQRRQADEDRRVNAELERRVAERTVQLSDSEERNRAVVNTAVDAIIMIDERGAIQRFNPGAERMFGYSGTEMAGKNVSLLMPSPYRAEHDAYLARYLATGEKRIIGTGRETVALRKDGTVFPIHLAVSETRVEGKRRFTGTIRDITDRKQAEEQLDRFFALSLDMLCIASADGYFKRVNPAFTHTLGWRIEEILARPFLDFVHPDDHAATLREVERQVAAGESVLQFENRYLHKDGSWRVLSWASAPHAGGVMFATARDITEEKRAAEQKVHLMASLEATNKELESFSYSVSHDLRAPLRSMDGFSLALLEDYGDKLDEEGKDALERIRAASQRMGDLIDDLLRLSQVTRVELNVTRVDLSAIAREIADAIDREQSGRSVEWAIEAGLSVRADPALMRIAMQNLLHNAWKFTGRTDRPVIRVGALDRNSKKVHFVADNGVGFDMAHADRLFGAFQRLHHAGEFPGTGIGLAIVQRIIRRHDGEIWAEAKEGAGATFFFSMKEAENGPDEQDHPAG